MTKETKFLTTRTYTDQRVEVSAETTLPDYNTDVRKILHFTAEPHPISAFASDGGLECSGEVTFSVIYLDSEGEVSSASFSADYSFTTPCDTTDYKDSVVETTLNNLYIRLMSPRKMSARATLTSSVVIVLENTVEVTGDALDDDQSPETESVFLECRNTTITKPKEHEYAEPLARFDGKTTDEVQLIHLVVTPIVDQIQRSGSEAELTGRINVEALIKTDESPLYKLEKSLDLFETIDLSAVGEGADLFPIVNVLSSTVSVSGDEAGVELILNLICEAQVMCEENRPLELLSDVYLCHSECDNIYTTLAYDRYLEKVVSLCEINEKVAFADLGCEKLREIVFADVKPRISAVERSENSLSFEGDIQVSAIANEMKNETDLELVPLKFSHKFSQNANITCQIGENVEIFPKVSMKNISVAVDSDYVYLRAIAAVTLQLSEKKHAEILQVSSQIPGTAYADSPTKIKVYYPTNGDTLYSIAKAYHTTKERIIADNSLVSQVSILDGEVSGKIKRLIIT